MTIERMSPKSSSGECETKAAIQIQLDMNETSLTQLNELVSDLLRRLGRISSPPKPSDPSSMKDVEPEGMSPLRADLLNFNLHIRRIIGQIEDLMNRLEI